MMIPDSGLLFWATLYIGLQICCYNLASVFTCIIIIIIISSSSSSTVVVVTVFSLTV